MQEPKVIDKLVSFDEDASTGDLLIKHEQYIPEDFISQLKRDKIDADHRPSADFERVASLPVILVEEWKRVGYDVFQEPVRKTIARLKAEGLDAFITTNKQV